MVREQTTVVRTAEEESISHTVVFAVAAARDVCASDLETPLYTAIDADALDALVPRDAQGRDPGAVKVEFRWAGCDVVVHGTGRVTVTASDIEAHTPDVASA